MSDTYDSRLDAVTDIITSYLSNNQVPASELPALIASVRAALEAPAGGRPAAEAEPVDLTPAVPVKKSITPDYLISLEDGRPYKSLKRHLQASYGMTPDDYRRKWGLPADYPMVAPNYAAARSALAKSMGLGRKRIDAVEPEPEPVAEAPAPKPRRGRAKKAA
ncbi:MucR family transcriptional regulator [Antarcticirhabdus aurantiaca]|uniref:MucR family transcriptional regulator n=1 Tax=Antarcticirhabdus aurantiaca TaxID=2606717 RepID=A0ACD4NPD6_9HYPH|nr:MucR family transcriptional regulator [Antarcticirhabdus aurantiaca]WAJ28795.1 MucR family transcriptional regulator [Jeongeuplla avenae]